VFVLLVYNLYSFRVSQSDFKTLSTSDHSYPSHERQYWPIHLPRLKLRFSRQPLCLFKSVLRLPIQQLTPCMPLPVWSAISNIQTIAVCEQALLQLTAQNISPSIFKAVLRDTWFSCALSFDEIITHITRWHFRRRKLYQVLLTHFIQIQQLRLLYLVLDQVIEMP